VEEPHSDESNVPIARRLATGRMNTPIARDQHWNLTRLLQERRQDSNTNHAKDLIGLAGIESDQAPYY
jgi:hypothetical protein